MEDTAHVLLSLAGILLGAKVVAAASNRLGLPAVFGELSLGVILGPSILGWLTPSETLTILADIGVIMLMFMAGMETDMAAIRRVGKASTFAAIGGVVVPMAAGLVVGILSGMDGFQAMFLGATLTATSVSISAQTLKELGGLRSQEGMTILGAAVIDDVLGVWVLALVLSLAGEGARSDLVWIIARMAIFFPVAWFLGRHVIAALGARVARSEDTGPMLAVLLSLLLLYAWAADALGSVAAITGAYLLGVLLSRYDDSDLSKLAHHGVATIGYSLFIPVFFVSIGLHADLTALIGVPGLAIAVVVIAVLTKIVGAGGGAWLGGLRSDRSLRVGCGMVSRGEVALVMASAGWAAGLLDERLLSVVIFMTLATTLVTPLLLRWSTQPYRRGREDLSLARGVAEAMAD